jgi:hypothetical protein
VLSRMRSALDHNLWFIVLVAATLAQLLLMGISLSIAGSAFHRSIGGTRVEEAAFLRGVTILKFVFILSTVGSLAHAVLAFTPGVLERSGGAPSRPSSVEASREARP